MPSNRSFGIFFCIIFLIVFVYLFFFYDIFLNYILFLSGIFFILAIIRPIYLYPFNLIWIKFGLLLNSIFAPIIITFIYFTLVTPIGLLVRLFKFDLLNLKKNNSNSYWIIEKKNRIDYKNE
jgi:hypothetical protein